MAEENKFYQLPADANTKPAQNPESGEDPPHHTTVNDREELRTNDDPDTTRESKRRKSCPSALDKCEAIFKSCCNSSLSFSFDPKFCSGVTTPEVTPKFGSFNLVAAMTAAEIKEKIEEKTEEEGEVEVEIKGEEDGETNQVIKKRKLVEISVDGIKTAD